MTKVSRDVLIVSKLSYLSEKAMEREYNRVIQLLYQVEKSDAHLLATEILDLPRFKIIRKPAKVAAFIRRNIDKPFLFVSNKN
jgi:hypothetical protein